MTICASVKVRDAIVLGTDSMTMVTGTGPGNQQIAVKSYANAHKLFQVGSLPIGSMTWGAGNIGTRTVESLMIEFGEKVNSKKVQVVTQELFDFVKPLYDAQFQAPNQPPMGFLVAGYSPKEPLAEEYEFMFPLGPVQPVKPNQTDVGAAWRGIDRPFSRLVWGIDPQITSQLSTSGISQDILNTLLDPNKWSMKIMFDAMPIQDAINFCEFVIRTTIGTTEFETGSPACGGPIQMAVIRPKSGFEWVAYPKLSLRGENQ